MTDLKKILAALALMALPLALPACKNPDDPNDPVNDLPTSEELSISAEPTFLEFRHVVGQSPCPQLVGRITLRNRGTTPIPRENAGQQASETLPAGSFNVSGFITR